MDTPERNADELPTIVVGVPGPWADLDQAMQALVDVGNGRYVGKALPGEEDATAGAGLVDMETDWACACEFRPRVAGLEAGFMQTGYGRVTPRDARAVSRHRSILMFMAPGGSVETARFMMDAVTLAIRAGGLGVFIESTGVAHAPHAWLKLAEDTSPGGLYCAFVATIGPKGPRRTCYTCGMHNFGHRDALTDMFDDPQEAAFILNSFLGYLYQSGKTVGDGDLIGSEEGTEGQHFRVVMEPCKLHDPQDLFHNPYGMWRIVPANAGR